MTLEDEETLIELKFYLTGNNGQDKSTAPLICNPSRPWYGKEVVLNKSEEYTIGHSVACLDFVEAWEEFFHPTPIYVLDDEFWVYIHENYWDSTQETIDFIVVEWANALIKKMDKQL